MASLYASGSRFPPLGYSSKPTSNPLYTCEIFFWRCSPVCAQHACSHASLNWHYLRIAGNLSPETPTMDSWPTLPLRRRSNKVSPTTPTFLSEVDAPPPTKPVVYSPVPTCNAY